MAITISVALQKGGTGKSTTAQALASTLGASRKKKKILLIDMDPQGNTTYSSNVDDPPHTIFNVLNGDRTADAAIVKCRYYDLLPSDKRLTNVEMAENVPPTLLADTLAPLKTLYDYIIIDTPPALGNLSFNALVFSDHVVIPCDPRPFALQGLSALYDTIQSIKQKLNPSLTILGILLVRYNDRTILNREIKKMVEEFAKDIHTTVFKTSIREGIAVAEAQTLRIPLIDHAKKSNPNIDYEAFTKELLRKIRR